MFSHSGEPTSIVITTAHYTKNIQLRVGHGYIFQTQSNQMRMFKKGEGWEGKMERESIGKWREKQGRVWPQTKILPTPLEETS